MSRKTNQPRRRCRRLTLSGLIMVLGLPTHLLAQVQICVPLSRDVDLRPYANEIAIGIGLSGKDSYKFGEWSGLTERGLFLIGDVHLWQRDAEDDASHWRFDASNLGLSSRELVLEGGMQGDFRLKFGFDQLTRAQFDSTSFIFRNMGSSQLTLPSGWVQFGNDPSQNVAQITGALQRFDIRQERRGLSMAFSKFLTRDLELVGNYRHERREGSLLYAVPYRRSPQNPQGTLFPAPLGSTTHQFDAGARYAFGDGELQFGYYGSIFDNDFESVRVQNPFQGGGPGGGPDWLATSLPPSNQFHQLQLNGAYGFGSGTRLTGTFARGQMTQNSSFMPYTSNINHPVTPPPRGSLDGRIETTLADVRLTARPLPELGLRAHYRYDDRDNATPQAVYNYIVNDSGTQSGGAGSRTVRTNLPYSYKLRRFGIDGDYELAKRTFLYAGYKDEQTKRTYSAAQTVNEKTWNAELRRTATEFFTGAVGYSRADRRNTGYDPWLVFAQTFQPSYVAANPPPDQIGLVKYNLANRARDKVTAYGTVSPDGWPSVTLRADFYRDRYTDSPLGLMAAKGQAYTADVAYAVTDGITAFAFYSREKIASSQAGFASGGGAGGHDAGGPPGPWGADLADRVDTFGFGSRAVLNEQWELGGDYAYARSVGATAMLATATAPVPDNRTRFHNLNLYARYQWKESIGLRFSYMYQKLASNDWAYDNAGAASSENVILTGQLAPNYSNHVFGMAVLLKY